MPPAGPDSTHSTHSMSHLIDTNEPLAVSATPPLPTEKAAAALPSEDLLRGHNTVIIEHNGTEYRLQKTRAGKLILTK